MKLVEVHYYDLPMLLMPTRQLLAHARLAPLWSGADALDQFAVAVLLCMVPLYAWQVIVSCADPVSTIRGIAKRFSKWLQLLSNAFLKNPSCNLKALQAATDPAHIDIQALHSDGAWQCSPWTILPEFREFEALMLAAPRFYGLATHDDPPPSAASLGQALMGAYNHGHRARSPLKRQAASDQPSLSADILSLRPQDMGETIAAYMTTAFTSIGVLSPTGGGPSGAQSLPGPSKRPRFLSPQEFAVLAGAMHATGLMEKGASGGSSRGGSSGGGGRSSGSSRPHVVASASGRVEPNV